MVGFEVKKLEKMSNSKTYLKHGIQKFKSCGFWIALFYGEKMKL